MYLYSISCVSVIFDLLNVEMKLFEIEQIKMINSILIFPFNSKGNTAFVVAHNFQPETLVRQIDLPHVEFNIEYQFMTHAMLSFLVERSRHCHQHFDYHCFDAPLGYAHFVLWHHPAFFLEFMAEQLEPWTSILEVPGSSPGPAVAPLGKTLYPPCLVFQRRL